MTARRRLEQFTRQQLEWFMSWARIFVRAQLSACPKPIVDDPPATLAVVLDGGLPMLCAATETDLVALFLTPEEWEDLAHQASRVAIVLRHREARRS